MESNLERRNDKGVKVGVHEKKGVSNAERGKKRCLSSVCVSMRVASEYLESNRDRRSGGDDEGGGVY